MKKKIIIFAVLAIIVYILFIRIDYRGSASFILDGKEYNLPLERAEGHDVGDGTIFRTVYSNGGNSIGFVFKVWEEDEVTFISLDNPRIQLNGERHHMTRPLRNRDYTIDALLSDYIGITLWDVPFDDGLYLTGGFTLLGSNTEFF